jgi:hypothetical protein
MERMTSTTALRFLSWAVNGMLVLLAIGTLLTIGLVPSSLTGDVGPLVDGTLSGPYTVTQPRGSRFDVTRYGQVPYTRDMEGREAVRGATTRVRVRVTKRDMDVRVIVAVGVAATLVLDWIALLAFRGVVFSAADGDPFDERNATRLRRMAATLVAWPVITMSLNRLLTRRLTLVGVRPHLARVSVVPFLVAALVVAALAEVFRRGAELRELEATTV